MRAPIPSLALAALLLVSPACKNEEKFPALGDAVASPVDVVASADGQRFYVLNADFDRTFNKGSILVLDKEGNKLGTAEVPRMGRTLTLAGNDLLVTIDEQDDKTGPRVQLFDVGANPNVPALRADWDMPCSPYNAVMREGYPYFFVGCTEGSLFIGELTADRGSSTLNQVRNYGVARRAMHLDTRRGLLFAFVTAPGKQTFSDVLATDATGYDDNANENPDKLPNEVPDDRESSRTAQANRGSRQIHQFVVYDIEKEKAAGFPFRPVSEAAVAPEFRWLYFKLRNFDGTPDVPEDPLQKYYRTNFWEAKPDLLDPSVFYLSHRGPTKDSAPHANQIVKVSLVDDPRAKAGDDGKLKVPHTDTYMTFERVYGFKGPETTKYSYPGDFEIAEVAGQSVILVNHFRDLVNWVRGDVSFSLAAKTLGDDSWFSEVVGDLSEGNVTTYYQVAMTQEGYVASCSFYGNSMIMLKVTPGVGLVETRRVQ